MGSIEQAATAAELLHRMCVSLVRELDGAACAVSQVIGDVLVQVAEDPGPLATLQLGHGYLVSDYPLTKRVLETLAPAAVGLGEGIDASEEEVLAELGFASVLMLPFVVGGRAWALVELYGAGGRRFGPADAERAAAIVGRAEVVFERFA